MSGINCGGGAAGGSGYIPAPGGPGGAFAVPGTLVGKDANRDGIIEQNEMGFIPAGMPGPMPGPDDGGDCDDCVRTITSFRTVQVPCTRNKYKVVNYTVPQTVPYTDYETVTRTRTVTKQVPKTIMVPTTEVVPYQTQVPVQRTKVIQVPKSRTECYPVTSIVQRRVPVVSLIPRRPEPCPADMGGPGAGGPQVPPGGAFAVQGTLVGKDANNDGVIEPNEMGFIPAGGRGGGGVYVPGMPNPNGGSPYVPGMPNPNQDSPYVPGMPNPGQFVPGLPNPESGCGGGAQY